jgi:hypothetical protein
MSAAPARQAAKPPPIVIQTAEAAHAFCQRLIDALDALKEALEGETRLLTNMEIDRVEEMYLYKTELARAYMGDIATFEANAASIGRLAPEMIDLLKDKHHAFREAIVANEYVLTTVKDVSEGLIRKAAEKVGAAERPTTYSSPGERRSKPDARRPAAVALDRQL